MIEEWRAVKGWEGHYEVSNLGRVASVDRVTTFERGGKTLKRLHEGCFLRSGLNVKGYAQVVLFGDNTGHSKLVHRLVAEAFIPNPENKSEVNHEDGNKLNNCVANLSWCTSVENHRHKAFSRLSNVRYGYTCNELGFSTYGSCFMQEILRERGYKASTGGIDQCAKAVSNSHCGLTFKKVELKCQRPVKNKLILLE